MGLVCHLVFQPIIRFIQVVVTIIEFILVQICRIIQELVNIIIQVLKYICSTVVHTVCNAVCSVVCGICDFFCGIFGCDCGCRNICNKVCKVVTDVVCGWTYVAETVLRLVTKIICDYILTAIIRVLHLIEAIVTMVLTWVCSIIDVFIRWLLCWTYIAEIFNNKQVRRFRVAPKVVPNDQGHSDWFVYVNNADASGTVDQNVQGYILSDKGKPLVPIMDRETLVIAYYEVAIEGNRISRRLKRDHRGEYVSGRPFYYYPYKVMEIASHRSRKIFRLRT